MASITDIRAAGTTITTNPIPIFEPLNPPEVFEQHLGRFGEEYNTSPDSHIYKFLSALCGDAGVGSVKKQLLLPKLQQQLQATYFTNLDRLYGDALTLPRLSDEIYTIDPQSMMLTAEEWADILAKDSAYRARCLTWMRALAAGPTPHGIALAAEAAVGVECDVLEQYRYLDTIKTNPEYNMTNIGQTNSRSEIIIIPREPSLTEQEKRRISKLVDKLRPANVLPTVYDGDYVRLERPAIEVSATSERFYVQRLVTGRADVDWPSVDLTKGYWIEPGVQKEAPTFSFMNRQETVTYLSIIDANASSEHVGIFNKNQQELFVHLSDTTLTDFFYSANRSFTNNLAQVQVTSPWTAQTNSPILINNYYPIGYFAQTNTFDLAQNPPVKFWASVEDDAGTSETLTYDFGRDRFLNYIDFNISQKPVSFTIQWLDGDDVTWHDVEPLEFMPSSFDVSYLPSNENPWHYFQTYFKSVTTSKIRINFTRRTDAFPLPTSAPFKWSIEVKSFHAMNVILTADNYQFDEGTDILGNAYQTNLEVNFADNVIDEDVPGEPASYWMSQPNPTRNAVEALYFDLRGGWQLGTQAYLDEWTQADLDTRSQKDMEMFYEDGVVIDEVFIDPVTSGPSMHIYYSDDDTPDCDNKLWTPIPRSYILRKGFAAFPAPTFVKYIKLEFTNLSPVPYQRLEYPQLPPITFRQFPSWVQDYFSSISSIDDQRNNIVEIDPQTFGFQNVVDGLDSSFNTVREPTLSEISQTELRDFISTLASPQNIDQESDINFYSPLMWQSDLISNLDLTRALGRVANKPNALTSDTGWNAELGLPISVEPDVQSVSDLTKAQNEKFIPTMWFPRQCRHGYQVIEAQPTSKIAYQVGINTVGFYRRDFTSTFDELYYVERLDDEAHTQLNQFTPDDWRFVVSV